MHRAESFEGTGPVSTPHQFQSPNCTWPSLPAVPGQYPDHTNRNLQDALRTGSRTHQVESPEYARLTRQTALNPVSRINLQNAQGPVARQPQVQSSCRTEMIRQTTLDQVSRTNLQNALGPVNRQPQANLQTAQGPISKPHWAQSTERAASSLEAALGQ
ncbi:hypothetical protein chiPu_0027084 [Chiloscyllium punctatum]|uniref:Uncharacterized protein n=1 Tax=Chiloscyllium punctatum TaxID=137246 RepID=A0A401TKJ1_CHIPU|nr:hypothetical protein [Chiloscyllium punctatum]